MKLFLLVIVIVCFTYIGVIIYLNYYKKKLLYSCLIEFCNYYVSNLKMYKLNKKLIFEKYLTNYCNVELTKIINCYANNKPIKIEYLGKNETDNILQFLNVLGEFDIENEINNINNYKAEFNSKLQTSITNHNKNGKLYLKLLIIFGLIIAIVLI